MPRALLADRSPGRAFAATSAAIATFFLALFVDLFPHTMVSSTSSRLRHDAQRSSSSHYTLAVMTVVAVLLVPVVLLYQGWTYWVFRQRVSAEDFGEVRDAARPDRQGKRREPGESPRGRPAGS